MFVQHTGGGGTERTTGGGGYVGYKLLIHLSIVSAGQCVLRDCGKIFIVSRTLMNANFMFIGPCIILIVE